MKLFIFIFFLFILLLNFLIIRYNFLYYGDVIYLVLGLSYV